MKPKATQHIYFALNNIENVSSNEQELHFYAVEIRERESNYVWTEFLQELFTEPVIASINVVEISNIPQCFSGSFVL